MKNGNKNSALALYSKAARRSSRQVIKTYSTSFGLASGLLSRSNRQHVINIYALVRIADEIVDGAAEEVVEAGGVVSPINVLNDLEHYVYRAMREEYSSNLTVHAFAQTANFVGIGREIIYPFFESMRMDLSIKVHDQASYEKYVYGSAEVVGLMCLAAFMHGRIYTPEQKAQLVAGARALGAAFQKVNFLRDLAKDYEQLHRSYFPEVSVMSFDEPTKTRLVAEIDADLAVARDSLRLLSFGARRGVAAAQYLFTALNRKIEVTPAAVLLNTRIRVAAPYKLWILVKAFFGATPK